MRTSGTKKASTSVQRTRYYVCLCVALDEGHVFPDVPLDLLLRYLKHLRAELNPDNPSLGPDTLLKHIEAEARAAAEIENGLAGLEVQTSDGVGTDAIRKTLPLVIFGGVASVAVFLGLGVVGVHMGDYTLSQRQASGGSGAMRSTGAVRGEEVGPPWLPVPRRRNRTYSPSALRGGRRLPGRHTAGPWQTSCRRRA